MNKRELGKNYEERAVHLAVEAGYNILAKNYHARVGEIDIVAEKNGMIVFIEVKYRKDETHGYGSESIDRKKLRRLYQAARKYLSLNGLEERVVRFDMIIFTGEQYFWDENILWGDEIWN